MHVLLVDDEPGHVLGFSKLLQRLKPDVAVSSARTGEEALRLCEARIFDLIFTDIQMPRMNGLEFMERLEPGQRGKVVVLSGYDFFEYARKALTFGAFDYLLKPVDTGRLEEVFRRAEALNERERLERMRQQELAARINRMEPAYSGKLLQAWAEGSLEAERMTELRALLPFTGPGAAVSIRSRSKFGRVEAGELQSLLGRRGGQSFCFVSEQDEREVICLLGGGPPSAACEAEAVAKAEAAIDGLADRHSKGSLAAGIGSRRESLLAEAHVSLREARLALQERFYEERIKVFPAGKSRLDDGRHPVVPTAAESALAEALRAGNEAALKAALHACFDHWRRPPFPPPHRLRAKCKLLLNKLLEGHEVLRESGTHGNFLWEIDEVCDQASGFAQLEEGCLEVLRKAVRTVTAWKEDRRNRLVQQCLDFIDERYAHDISLESTAERFGLSPGYFSQYFKNKLNINFTAYLTQVRLSKAKTFLERENKRIYQVAEAVGYSDVKYFNRVFKKEFGMTPEEYRKTLRLLQGKRGRSPE